MREEIINAKVHTSTLNDNLTKARRTFKEKLPIECRASVVLHTRYDIRLTKSKQSSNLDKQLSHLSKEQDKPLFNVKNTIICYQLESTPPKYVLETLSLGPKNSILDGFDQKRHSF